MAWMNEIMIEWRKINYISNDTRFHSNGSVWTPLAFIWHRVSRPTVCIYTIYRRQISCRWFVNLTMIRILQIRRSLRFAIERKGSVAQTKWPCYNTVLYSYIFGQYTVKCICFAQHMRVSSNDSTEDKRETPPFPARREPIGASQVQFRPVISALRWNLLGPSIYITPTVLALILIVSLRQPLLNQLKNGCFRVTNHLVSQARWRMDGVGESR